MYIHKAEAAASNATAENEKQGFAAARSSWLFVFLGL